MLNVILCGGSGTRLWPISRDLMPKQFIKLFNEKSLFQITVERNKTLCESNYILSNKEHYYLASEQCSELFLKENIQYILESEPRNTAPALAFACMAVPKETILLVTPSDHLIKNQEKYEEAVKKAQLLAEQGFLVTFGIKPTKPETGYGYIEVAQENNVCAFHEKPNIETAQQYIENGNFYWNAGIFCFQAGAMLEEIKHYANDVYTACCAVMEKSLQQNNIIKLDENFMKRVPSISIDYAVFEKSQKVKCIKADFDWNDLGSFDSLYQELEKDENQNVIYSSYTNINSYRNFIYSSSLNKKLIATIDINDLIIVDTGDALLVAPQKSAQKVKKIVEKIQKNTTLTHEHKTIYRPWGSYTILEDDFGYKIKKIEVKPGKRLSLQKHFHRNEHWIVLSGTATVQIGDKTILVRPNESTYIQMGEVHRLSNEGRIPVVMIEAQVGEYTGEDDIVRIDDDFKR